MTWKYKTTNKRGAFGETDFEKKTITINKKRHKSKNVRKLTPNKDGSENLLTTIAHEFAHKNHPKINSEKKIEKLARAMVSKMSPKRKAKLYRKFQ